MNLRVTDAELLDGGAAVRVGWSDGFEARFHAIWLRDNALEADTRDPVNAQRLVTLLDIPADTRIEAAAPSKAGALDVDFQPARKRASYPALWLKGHAYDKEESLAAGWIPPVIRCWDSQMARAIPSADYQDVRSDPATLLRWLMAVRRYGFALLRDVPALSGHVCEVAELFGFVRETNYGRWFDVRSEISPENLAYTSLALQAHTDNPYRDPVPTLQLLACLQNSVDGGESIVVDGFAAVRRLQSESPSAFDLLSRYCVRFEYAGAAGIRLRSKRPIIELSPDGELVCVRFNNRAAAPFVDIPFDAMAEYYLAYRTLVEIIERPDMQIVFAMAPGDLLIVENTRVLHARNAFSGAGFRWLQGCYADKDSLMSVIAAAEVEVGEVENRV